MTIRLLNHASILITHKGLRLVCDPWLEGTAYAQSIGLLAPSVIDYEEFSTVQYIWFSGEQEDRFSLTTLQKIPLKYRENITILHYANFDKKLIIKCQEIGFLNCIALKSENWLQLSDDFSIRSEAFGEGAWACFTTHQMSVLHIANTSIRNNKKGKKILQKIGGEPEWLLTQSNLKSYIHHFQKTKENLEKKANESIEIFKEQLELFEPKIVIPISDFKWFCHIENNYLNQYLNPISQFLDIVNQETYGRTALLFPNDELEEGIIPKTEQALKNWTNIKQEALKIIQNQPIDITLLQKQITVFNKQFSIKSLFFIRKKFQKTRIYISDYNKSYIIHLQKGLLESLHQKNECDVILSSEVLLYCLEFSDGIERLSQYGRICATERKRAYKFYNLFKIRFLYFRNQPLTMRILLQILTNKFITT